VLFYVLIAWRCRCVMPTDHRDAVMVFVITRFVHARISSAPTIRRVRWRVGRRVVLLAMWSISPEDSAADLIQLHALLQPKACNDPAARLSAAIELIDTIEAQRSPAGTALKDGAPRIASPLRRSRGDRRPGLGCIAPARVERLGDGG